MIRVLVESEPVPLEFAGSDFEEALAGLRREFEARDWLLLINRFRRNAVVTGMSRGMSNGLACYLVWRGLPVDRRMLANCLDPAPEQFVVTQAEADRFARGFRTTYWLGPIAVVASWLQGWAVQSASKTA